MIQTIHRVSSLSSHGHGVPDQDDIDLFNLNFRQHCRLPILEYILQITVRRGSLSTRFCQWPIGMILCCLVRSSMVWYLDDLYRFKSQFCN